MVRSGRLWNSVSTIFSPLGYVIGHWKLFIPAPAVMYRPRRSFLSAGIDAGERVDHVAVGIADGQHRVADRGLVEEVHDAYASLEILTTVDHSLGTCGRCRALRRRTSRSDRCVT